eukprot:gene2458-2794_t
MDPYIGSSHIDDLHSEELIKMEDEYAAHTYHPIPVVFKKAAGVFVWDTEEKRYYDFLSSYSAVNQGHSHPKIVSALITQAQKCALSSRAFYNEIFPQYAKYITEFFGYEMVLPMNTGAEAVETGIKLARRWGYVHKQIPENQAVIICCKGCFHGRTIGVISLSDDPSSFSNYGPLLTGIAKIDYNNTQQLEDAIQHYAGRVCGFIVEPIQGEAGVVVPDEGYLKKCYEICKKNNVLLIADEIQTGLCRTGKLLCSDWDNIKPDVLLLGKAISGGLLPISAVLSSKEVMLTIKPGEHGSTYGGSPLASAVAMAALSVLREESLSDNAQKLGEIFRKEISDIKSPLIIDVRGRGLLNAIVVDPKSPISAWEICMMFAEKGLLAKPTHENIIRLAPPLTITLEQMRECIEIIATVFNDYDENKRFRLAKSFVDGYRGRPAPFGFGVLGELVYRRTYSRIKPDGTNEQWFETVERVVNGTFTMQRQWIERHGLAWNAPRARTLAQNMYERIFSMKFLPPGRGLWAMGSPLTETRGLYAALNNCAFVSTETMRHAPSKPFIFLMDASMLGVGVGFDTKGAGTMTIKGPRRDKTALFTIPDSREGWVESVRLLLDSYFHNKPVQQFEYNLIRGEGEAIKGFGGHSSGPESLKMLHQAIINSLEKEIDRSISVTTIVDLMNLIGKCVVSANTRQTAEIAFGDPNSEEYINLKNYKVNPHRADYGWTSNNSVFASLGMDYEKVCDRIIDNGEPGFAWLDNMQKFSRMDSSEGDNKDIRAVGGNPCLEQTLESFEVCCLVETFPNNHTDLNDYLETLKFAFMYAKTVTLGKTQWPDTNRVLLRNRRIGCSMSGIAQFITEKGLNELKRWSIEGYKAITEYDKYFSEWLAIPRSIKTTSIKPSGTVSLLAGATPGMHYPISEYYIRRVRLQRESGLLAPLIEAGYKVEQAAENKFNMVVEIPIHAGKGIRKAKSLTMWEQLSLAAFLQKYWADNQVSCTVSFNPATEGPQLQYALDYFQYQLKGVSFLPVYEGDQNAYQQMPYEEIDQETYERMTKDLKPVAFNKVLEVTEPKPDKFCDSSACQTLLSINTNTSEPENLS